MLALPNLEARNDGTVILVTAKDILPMCKAARPSKNPGTYGFASDD
ncbi:hypothetical protein B0G84_8258 [Paraburkholderia sp. BL8N3]|nr:hypothetical protein [Paraburkholderia sp. BL8N3]TCK32458.1 hypothetical protein B0G84_8258 [Paraburkholderia sp. BL8N3]